MAADNESVISTLNNLIETARDGQNGFLSASEGASRTDLRTLFNSYAQQRAQFVGELQQEVRALGGDPETAGSVSASLHRGWINIKSVVTGRDDNAILEECERGEDVAVKTYEEALGGGLPGNVEEVVRRQFAQVKEAHDRVRNLRNQSRGA